MCVTDRHAGVYTAEEVALITREKLIRLQSLYIDQFKRLQHLLKEKKRRYLHNRKVEHETLGKNMTILLFLTASFYFGVVLISLFARVDVREQSADGT